LAQSTRMCCRDGGGGAPANDLEWWRTVPPKCSTSPHPATCSLSRRECSTSPTSLIAISNLRWCGVGGVASSALLEICRSQQHPASDRGLGFQRSMALRTVALVGKTTTATSDMRQSKSMLVGGGGLLGQMANSTASSRTVACCRADVRPRTSCGKMTSSRAGVRPPTSWGGK
jgi:hypothetical protein